jgi:hypothetical protein
VHVESQQCSVGYVTRESTEPSAAKTKMAVARNSEMAARMVSGWVASSLRPTVNRTPVLISTLPSKPRDDENPALNEDQVRDLLPLPRQR